jgi:hypothetical protein
MTRNREKGTPLVTSDRDYLADMAVEVDRAIPSDDYVAAIVAQSLIDHLYETDRDLLLGWLLLKAPAFMANEIAKLSNSRRSRARINAPRGVFAAAAADFETTGSPVALSVFSMEYVIDTDNTRRRVSAMTAADCEFVADRYTTTAANARLQAAFHNAVAKRIGSGTVSDVFTEEQYMRMYQSLTGLASLKMAG